MTALVESIGLVEGKVVVVTGGSSGIGRAVCRLAASEGAAGIVVAALHEQPREGGRPIAEELAEAGTPHAFVRADVTRPEDFDAVIAAADGMGGVDVLVTCAGISDSVDVLEVTPERMRRVMGVNFEGTVFACQAAARSMRAREVPGSIVTISSVGGMRGFAHAATYSASKGAVRTFTYALADALGPHGIRVNAIHPGQVETEMLRVEMRGGSPIRIPLGRKGTPEEIAEVVLFAASDRAGYLHGASLVVDGGYSAVI
ncbi:SDR family oxidoreductase [Microbacterium pseudoresistens]|uniref:NAD(P)-dependent dehydrogenase (Short-subunit alcohol dehydrogenase family) n=1 Tax=Microbacterium pseudoresistens TaxID=640634 RepID=A0A7Y9EW56_9MICO|nr:glucose 1-dehydrogenase [Microbacterium pseudoresistens]NYD54926.1 NAD(P)-dependent dehydrogenase (short-subunit alcohol dehydrogenase family) [Microbacterium pseudoresistens]